MHTQNYCLMCVNCLGVSVILATATSGSLKEEITPGSLVFLDSFIDRYIIYPKLSSLYLSRIFAYHFLQYIFRTFKREITFHDGREGNPAKGVCHIPSHPAYNEKLRQASAEFVFLINNLFILLVPFCSKNYSTVPQTFLRICLKLLSQHCLEDTKFLYSKFALIYRIESIL